MLLLPLQLPFAAVVAFCFRLTADSRIWQSHLVRLSNDLITKWHCTRPCTRCWLAQTALNSKVKKIPDFSYVYGFCTFEYFTLLLICNIAWNRCFLIQFISVYFCVLRLNEHTITQMWLICNFEAKVIDPRMKKKKTKITLYRFSF